MHTVTTLGFRRQLPPAHHLPLPLCAWKDCEWAQQLGSEDVSVNKAGIVNSDRLVEQVFLQQNSRQWLQRGRAGVVNRGRTATATEPRAAGSCSGPRVERAAPASGNEHCSRSGPCPRPSSHRSWNRPGPTSSSPWSPTGSQCLDPSSSRRERARPAAVLTTESGTNHKTLPEKVWRRQETHGSVFPPSSEAPMAQKHRRLRYLSATRQTRRRQHQAPDVGEQTPSSPPDLKALRPHCREPALLGRRGWTSPGVLDFFAKLMILYESIDLLPKMCIHIHRISCVSANSDSLNPTRPKQPGLEKATHDRGSRPFLKDMPHSSLEAEAGQMPPVWRRR